MLIEEIEEFAENDIGEEDIDKPSKLNILEVPKIYKNKLKEFHESLLTKIKKKTFNQNKEVSAGETGVEKKVNYRPEDFEISIDETAKRVKLKNKVLNKKTTYSYREFHLKKKNSENDTLLYILLKQIDDKRDFTLDYKKVRRIIDYANRVLRELTGAKGQFIKLDSKEPNMNKKLKKIAKIEFVASDYTNRSRLLTIDNLDEQSFDKNDREE